MNAVISMNSAEIRETTKTEIEQIILGLKMELDDLFLFDDITTPEQVIAIYHKLKQYKDLSGSDYKITFEENSIV